MAAFEQTPAHFPVQVTFVMCSHTRCLGIVRATVAALASAVGWDEAGCRAITLAIDEALANVIRHAYHGRTDGRIELECLATEGELQFSIADTGDSPDLAQICAREVGCDKIGGLGTHIIRDVMDVVSYQKTPQGNRFTASKRLRKET